MTPWVAATLAGRCANGYERGRGSVVHAVPPEATRNGWGIALCGRKPGRRSAGWSERDVTVNVTCPRCLAAIEREQRGAIFSVGA
jgi:hypothetical protein